jgi:energy-coupling factor transporter ATP-binding protein EcfA2
MDFFTIKTRSGKKGELTIYPDFKVCRSNDLMVRGKSVYAIWDEALGLWTTDEYDVQRLVDEKLYEFQQQNHPDATVSTLANFSSSTWTQFRNYVASLSDSYTQLDNRLTFKNTVVHKKDFVSKRLPYPLEDGSYEAFDEIIGTLYSPEERAKIEWAIGAIVAGEAKDIQKFLVFYGSAGTGKSTILNIIQKLFEGYYTIFEAKELTSGSNAFATEAFKANPLVAIQHDGDLSKIEDNTKLNSIVSHEEITMNEKFKPSYTARVNCFLFMGTNQPVKITDAKSGIIRRLIDVRPTGQRIPAHRYQDLMSRVYFELSGIAKHCLDVYRGMGKEYYNGYRPLDMIMQTDVFSNFVEENFDLFKEQDGCTLVQAWDMYKLYCDEALIQYRLQKHKFRGELQNYFREFHSQLTIDGERKRSVYVGFITSKFTAGRVTDQSKPLSLVLDTPKSLLDDICAEYPAQYATDEETPSKRWDNVRTKLAEIDTSKLHYVRLPENHIVIDFDLKDEHGQKSAALNLEAASKWPPTYAEYSKSGSGIHLHYIYAGDPTELSRVYSDGIEVKVFTGASSLRRRLSLCNTTPIATINTHLPLKEKRVLNFDAVKSEKGLRDLIKRNLNKDIHPGTKPSVDFISKILEDAYNQGLSYDITDLRPKILSFALHSSNHSAYCIKVVKDMKFKSDEPSENHIEAEGRLVYFDVEVFPNLFVVCWKFEGSDDVVRMINPTAPEIEKLLRLRLVGFNNRRYDNHILYARYMGYDLQQLFELSQRMINGSKNGGFAEAYGLSYADIYDYSSKKMGLKKFEIELGLHHHELGLPWEEPVPEDKWDLVAEYCENDVRATEAVAEDRKEDFNARHILADLSGLTVNDTTQKHTARIVFGKDKNPQKKFVYTDLSKMFPGYKYSFGKSTYRGENVGEGGYVYAEPGMYTNVALLDVASMHPSSIELLDAFGPYTKNFSQIKQARIAIKRHEFDAAREMLGGILVPYLTDEKSAEQLAYALKIVINIVYGLTAASFENPFRDPRNVDNIVAKRGALFMIDLKNAVQEQGFTVAHVKTDSIKIPNATPEIISFVTEFGKKYGYEFEHEATYEKMCLVNDAVYIAKYDGKWTATGAQFAQPYVFKTLFSKEPIEFRDMCETKTVTTALYLDMNEDLGPDEHDYRFVGKAGLFTPIVPGEGGGILLREKEDKFYAAGGTKGYRWLESETVTTLGKESCADRSYYDALVDRAVEDISNFGDFEWFTA